MESSFLFEFTLIGGIQLFIQDSDCSDSVLFSCIWHFPGPCLSSYLHRRPQQTSRPETQKAGASRWKKAKEHEIEEWFHPCPKEVVQGLPGSLTIGAIWTLPAGSVLRQDPGPTWDLRARHWACFKVYSLGFCCFLWNQAPWLKNSKNHVPEIVAFLHSWSQQYLLASTICQELCWAPDLSCDPDSTVLAC